ncbi:putative leucine-rich repeat receptor-like protein kinase [Planoprotostelium fungivorum]|uniref:Putative leucine-rich repeat receptor-like protein kinase n=1 Tax=Planoprotostelium fungivorum TaxID=1890364 RepID=A0A2P6N2S9_9EUKA|nr:putative leucine-rich repeat receptor-like protein kinase [Planoprotostelium fungivorum]
MVVTTPLPVSLCVFAILIGIPESSTAIDLYGALQNIWMALEGPTPYWSGMDICNAKDYIGVTCDSTGSWPTSIRLSSKNLNGTLSPSIGDLVNLTSIDLGNNHLSGPIPDTIGQLVSLTRLDLYYNRLNGSIPDSIGNLTSLQYLSLFYNQLTGPIPDSICNLAPVTTLYLSSNRLSGSIPSCIGNLHLLKYLWLYDNQLNGPIPNSIGDLISLSDLHFGNNQLNGSIPSTIGDLTSLTSLILYGNQLSGPLPDSICNLHLLNQLLLESNKLTGPIPSSIGNLASLSTLWLHGNMMSGPIPDSIGDTSLQQILLNSNRFDGVIPASMGKLSKLTTIMMPSNQFTGSIPQEVIDLPILSYFDVSHNLLNGTVPDRNSSLPAVSTLLMSSNRLTSVGYINVTGSCSLDGNAFPCLPTLNVSTKCVDSVVYLPCTSSSSTTSSSTSSTSSTTSSTSSSSSSTTSSTSTSSSSTTSSTSSSSSTSSTSSSSTTSITPTTFITDHTNVTVVVQTLYDNNTKISATDAKNILNSTLQNNADTVQVISAVVVALLRNTTAVSFDYNTKDVSIKLQTYNTTSLNVRESISSKIENSSVAVALPASVFSSQQQVSVSLSSVSYNPFESVYNETIPVIGVSVYAQGKEIDVRGVSELINVTMGSITSIPSGYEAVCQYWNETFILWSRDGCSLVFDADVAICQCTHLTNFSIGVQPRAAPTEQVIPPSQDSGSSKTKLIIIACCSAGGLLLILIVSLLVYRKMHRYKRDDTETNLSVVVDTEGIEFQKKIGEGKRGQVWKSTYKETTVVAVKKLIEGIDIERECDVAKGLHHPNIVQYLGRSLKGVSKALSYISSMDMVHISVVPSKILLSGMTAKLNCFSCIVAESSPYRSKSDRFYTAPEVIEDKRYRASGHVYNVGVLLWSMVTGSYYLYDTAREGRDVKVAVDKTMDEKVSQLIVDCTKKRPEERPSLKGIIEKISIQEEKRFFGKKFEEE